MNGPEHIAIGAASTGLVLYGMSAAGAPIGWTTALAAVASVGLGSLAPDIDHPRATIGYRLPGGILSIGLILLFLPVLLRVSSSSGGMFAGVFVQVQAMMGAWPAWGGILVAIAVILFLVSAGVTGSFGHRGPVHTFAVGGVATVVAVIVCAVLGIAPWYGLLFGFGWVMHLLADATTHDGLPSLLWPAVWPDSAGGTRAFGFLYIPLVLFGLTGWFFLTGTLSASTASPASVVVATPGLVLGTPNSGLALEHLRETAPSVAKSLFSAGMPVVAARGSYTAYTWQYIHRSGPSSVVVKTVTVTLDSLGRMVSLDQP